jgi:preprotein translocase subunit SecF
MAAGASPPAFRSKDARVEFFSHQTNYPFMATRKVWYTLSAVLMLISFGSFFTRGLNLGNDFTGGVSGHATFSRAPSVDDVRSKLVAAGFHGPQVQNFGSSRDLIVRLPPQRESATEIHDKIEKAVKAVDPAAQVAQLDVVGPQVGSELKTSAIWALSFTLILIFIYIAFRFHTWRLSFGAILAVLHDPILVIGLFSVTQTEFDLPVVAAILAVIGYSLNDTVVVFDRIRERFETNRRLAPPLVLDQSINQTLSRTIMTKVVTSIVVVALLFLGGPVLHGFSEALMIGIIAGTYSSIYLSSAIALDCGLTAEHVFPPAHKSAVDETP